MKSLGTYFEVWEQPVVVVCGVVPVAAKVPAFPSIVHIPALPRDHCGTYKYQMKRRLTWLIRNFVETHLCKIAVGIVYHSAVKYKDFFGASVDAPSVLLLSRTEWHCVLSLSHTYVYRSKRASQ